jgi:DNA-binding PadR family transcriptional regulator
MAKRSSALKPGSKIAEFFSHIKREMSGPELVLSPSRIQELKEEFKIGKVESVYGMLQTLERKGLIERKRRQGEGIIVSFPATEKESESQPKQVRGRRHSRSKRSKKRSKRVRGAEKASPTLDELISKLGDEIEDLKKELDSRTKLHDQLVAAREELKRRW